jgi:hypothetical protein
MSVDEAIGLEPTLREAAQQDSDTPTTLTTAAITIVLAMRRSSHQDFIESCALSWTPVRHSYLHHTTKYGLSHLCHNAACNIPANTVIKTARQNLRRDPCAGNKYSTCRYYEVSVIRYFQFQPCAAVSSFSGVGPT